MGSNCFYINVVQITFVKEGNGAVEGNINIVHNLLNILNRNRLKRIFDKFLKYLFNVTKYDSRQKPISTCLS